MYTASYSGAVAAGLIKSYDSFSREESGGSSIGLHRAARKRSWPSGGINHDSRLGSDDHKLISFN